MTHAQLKEIIQKMGTKQKELARKAGVTDQAISLFLRGRFKSRRLAEFLDRELGVETGLQR